VSGNKEIAAGDVEYSNITCAHIYAHIYMYTYIYVYIYV